MMPGGSSINRVFLATGTMLLLGLWSGAGTCAIAGRENLNSVHPAMAVPSATPANAAEASTASAIGQSPGVAEGAPPRTDDSRPVTYGAPSFNPTGRELLPVFFGLHIHRADTIPWPTVPFTRWRLWDTYTNWTNLEPHRGQYAFSKLDKFVDLAERHHKQLILVLGMTPQWASSRPDEWCPYGKGCAAPPASIADWDTYVRKVMTRYKGRIACYEVWNEPGFSDMKKFEKGFFSGTAADMVELAKAAHRAMKEIDPSARLLSPSFHEDGGVPRLDRFLQLGGKAYVDVVSHHFYRSAPEAIPALANRVGRVLLKHGMSGIPVWNTESGYLVQNRKRDVKAIHIEPRSWSSRVLTQEALAGTIPRSFAVAFASGIERYYWYAWDNRIMGIAEDEGLRAGAAAQAWLRSVEWLSGSRIDGCGPSQDKQSLWICQMRRGETRKAWMAWNTTGPMYWKAPAAWKAVTFERLAEPRSLRIRSGAVELGPEPILIKADVDPWRD